ncbi:MAG: 3-dehydroquinate dehydratase [Acidobacteriota bacterium]|nr:3-dehydroquinate dehydratase [Acidobacteriota bacterium]MDE3043755.1 3-dehydroquinate dehydratase [Acidobacteriota bacterium]MDE3108249.1 3-dehydroquinate dehydratase [Acidobacteriota bacterium]MDE3222509.1 3-dehydroquinate dehydratase [Acidobacteriota bacterium]
MSNVIFLLSGPNLDELGIREPALYGTTTLAQHVARFTERASAAGCAVVHRQSNFEGDLVEAIHEARQDVALAIVINAGALTHYSWSLRDALANFSGIKIEVHLSNPLAREDFRHVSTLANVVDGSIAGFHALSYDLALEAVLALRNASA